MRVPSSYHEVAFDAVAQLPYPADKPNRSRWSATRLAEIARYEGAAITVMVASRTRSTSRAQSPRTAVGRPRPRLPETRPGKRS
jgi:hypothetical protein